MSGSRSNHLGSLLMLTLAATTVACWSLVKPTHAEDSQLHIDGNA